MSTGNESETSTPAFKIGADVPSERVGVVVEDARADGLVLAVAESLDGRWSLGVRAGTTCRRGSLRVPIGPRWRRVFISAIVSIPVAVHDMKCAHGGERGEALVKWTGTFFSWVD